MTAEAGRDQTQARSTPTTYQLQAAVLAARTMDPGGNTRAALRRSYAGIATSGLYHPDALEAGDRLLERAGLISPSGRRLVPTERLITIRELPDDVAAEVLLQELFLNSPPLWLYAAVSAVEVRWENVPEADQESLEQILSDARRREAMLLALGSTLDAEQLADLGAVGEEHVVDACKHHLGARSRADLAAKVQRVSLRSDALGYDVTCIDTAGTQHRMEVKTTSSPALVGVEFFLSRNEATVGERDPCWSLVAVQQNKDESLEIIGWCKGADIVPHLPKDLSPNGRWSSVRLSIPTSQFRPGLPLDS